MASEIGYLKVNFACLTRKQKSWRPEIMAFTNHGILYWSWILSALVICCYIALEIYMCIFALSLCYFGYRYLLKQTQNYVNVDGQGAVITGCDTGIGHATALRLHRLGLKVFAGCLNIHSEGADILRREGPDNIHVIPLDVTSDESVQNMLDYVSRQCPEPGIQAVVNNAAINILADVELATMDMYHRVAEVNMFGMIRIAKAFAPLIRKYKGRFVNVTSVKGRMAGPLDSTYTITKWAGEAFSDILRREMRRFGVKVVIVEPGDYGGLTGMLSAPTIKRMESDLNQAWKMASSEVKNAYGREYMDELVNGIKNAGTWCAPSLDPVIDAMVDAILSETPRYRYLIDGSKKAFDKFCVFARLEPFLPEALLDYFYPMFFPLPKVTHER